MLHSAAPYQIVRIFHLLAEPHLTLLLNMEHAAYQLLVAKVQ